MASAYQFFEKAEQLEMACAELYRALAVQFEADPGARALFERLAQEEVQHAKRVRLLASRYSHDPKLFDNVDMAVHELETLLAEARQVVADVAAGAWGGNLEVVKGALADLEARFVTAHAHVIAAAAHPSLKAFFEQLAIQDAGHAELLRS
jgi:rubrerythrin